MYLWLARARMCPERGEGIISCDNKGSGMLKANMPDPSFPPTSAIKVHGTPQYALEIAGFSQLSNVYRHLRSTYDITEMYNP